MTNHSCRIGSVTAFVLLVVACSVFASAAEEKANKKKQDDSKRVRTVAVLIFNGVELLDFAGPAEVFIVTNHGRSYRVVTVAGEKKTIKTMGGIQVIPEFSIADAPQADILVVPGGGTSNIGAATRKWIVKSAKKAEIVMSVCMGAFVLADVGLLDGVEATTHSWGLGSLSRAAPKCKVVRGKRFVDSGKIITTAGVTAGIDGALRIVERLNGKEAAEWTAKEWMEYRGGKR